MSREANDPLHKCQTLNALEGDNTYAWIDQPPCMCSGRFTTTDVEIDTMNFLTSHEFSYEGAKVDQE